MLAGFFYYKDTPSVCVVNDTYHVFAAFTVMILAFASFVNQALYLLLFFMFFPVLCFYFINNPSGFYANFGIDPVEQ